MEATAADLLPDGWQGWPPQQKLRLLATLQTVQHPDFYQTIARPDQLPPEGEEWDTWLVNAGRGYGKTRTGAEWAWRQAETQERGALVAPTKSDARDVIVEGESGLLAVAPPRMRPEYEPSKRRLTYPNGAKQYLYSADEPDRLRGPQHHYAWVDEWAAMRRGNALMDMLLLGLRLGDHPRVLITTTPRPLKHLRELMGDERTVTTGGTTYDNIDNLAPTFKRRILARYEGTRLGRQELHAEILDDVEGALWKPSWFEDTRTDEPGEAVRVVVGVDPAVTAHEESDETGIIVASILPGDPSRFQVLADYSGRYTPEAWAKTAADAYDTWQADSVVAEVNQGGDMVSSVFRNVAPWVKVKQVRASRGKQVRAEPVAALYEQGRVAHVGRFAELEDQLVSFVPGLTPKSPDRLDALVWAVSDLMKAYTAPPVRTFQT